MLNGRRLRAMLYEVYQANSLLTAIPASYVVDLRPAGRHGKAYLKIERSSIWFSSLQIQSNGWGNATNSRSGVSRQPCGDIHAAQSAPVGHSAG